MTERAYLDWNATAPLRPEARAAMAAALDLPGNPSSIHAEGRAVRAAIERARAQVAALFAVEPADVTFTSGGTEANGLALNPEIQVSGGGRSFDRLLVSAIEHPAVLGGGRFAPSAVEILPVTPEGLLDLVALQRALTGPGRPLVSVMLANNETGILQPVPEAAHLVHEAGGLLHVDAVQAPGRVAVEVGNLGADLVSVSAHKLGGPKGVGALIRRSDAIHIATPLMRGGGQERGIRAGTENVAGIVGFGAAAEICRLRLADEAAHQRKLQKRLEDGIRAASPGSVIFGAGAARLPNTTLVALPGLKAETAVIACDLAGLAVSSGSACSSGKVEPSHVLAAMGVAPALAQGAVRVSLGFGSSEADIEMFLKTWKKLSESLGRERRGIAA
ncbi:MAG: cysteine desulfurase [Pseudorhodoplanes sp.]|nr:cysteine desulfurase [Pseudorhodoplanes sp.]